MRVFVVSVDGKGLMPTTPRKARLLLKEGKAEVFCKNPFTIRLKYRTGGTIQPLAVGIDTGEGNIGIAVLQENRILFKAEVKLRSSMEKKKLITIRREYRRGRRYRNTRYRHPKFCFHTVRRYHEVPDRKGRHWQKEPNKALSDRRNGWLPPSLESKVQHHIHWIQRMKDILPPTAHITIEVGRFDIARIKNPGISGEDYQKGRMYGYESIKAYALARFGYKCPVCGHKFDKEHKVKMHHIHMRKNGATDNPDEFAPVCHLCHTPENHGKGGKLDKLMNTMENKIYTAPTFMNILRRRMFRAFSEASFTCGDITAADRKVLNLSKTHADDAVAIAAGNRYKCIIDDELTVLFRQVRTKKRSLHEANPRKGRKETNRTAKRNAKNTRQVNGFRLYDAVSFGSLKGYVSGFTGSSVRLVDFEGKYIIPEGRSYSQIPASRLTLVSKRTNNYVQKPIRQIPPHPMEDGDSSTF